MIINSIKLHNFRNYGRLDINVGPSVNIFYGDNAQGKTNLIESINVCSTIISHRTSKDRDLIRLGEDEYEITLDLKDTKDDYSTSIFAGFYTEKSDLISGNTSKRILKQDGIQVERIADYLGICNTVIFAPEDLNIVKGAPAARRKFLNTMISKLSPVYFDLLSRTNRLINQKNAYLRSCGGNPGKADDTALDFWDYSLSDLTAEMIIKRYRYILLLYDRTRKHHLEISDGAEEIEMSYSALTGSVELIDAWLDTNGNRHVFITQGLPVASESELKARLSEYVLGKLRGCRRNDIEKGVSTIGIHRDDIEIRLNNLQMRAFSSQGQQRSAALSLKLSELDLIKEITGTAPVLLLDDVFSELDVNRRVKLLSDMTDAQIFITCTDRSYIEDEISHFSRDNRDIKYFRVTGGDIVAE